VSSYERSGWRDEEISRRHRLWGGDCPAVDIDFPLAEFHLGLPVALIEYKHFRAKVPDLRHATYRALRALADKYNNGNDANYNEGPLPFLVVFYRPDVWAYRVIPVNDAARLYFADPYEVVTELEYVKRIYDMRSLVLSKGLMRRLNTTLPEDWDAS